MLDSGSASGTNKFGLLLALIDLAPMVPADGFVGDVDLATKLIEIHWDHGRPYGAHVLRQTTAHNKENIVVVAEVESLRAHLLTSNQPTAPFEHVVPMIDVALWNGSVKRVIAATRANPLKRLQVLDRQRTTFLYEIEGGGLRFLPQAQQALVRFGPVLRDLVEFRFVRFVAAANRKALGVSVEVPLAEHLFGFERHMPPVLLRQQLWQLQAGRCLYTGVELDAPSLDHVVPWARVRVSAIENFVLTTKPINSAKGSLLLAPSLMTRWCEYVRTHRRQLRDTATAHGWPFDLQRVADVAAALYDAAADGTGTWAGPGKVMTLGGAGRTEIHAALGNVA